MKAFKSCLACLSRKKFEHDTSAPEDVVDLFKRYSDNDVMTAEQLQRFILEVQNEKKTPEEVESLMNASTKEKGKQPKFNLNNFFCYLFNDVLNPPLDAKVHHDMSLPMSHYYIYTGHNSYLTGNQLSSDCSEKPIIEALKRGVRVIELDLWPNSRKDDIHVKHGGTLTAPVKFEKCITAIRDNAFVKSEYPVVITFEDHLTAPLQAKAAEVVHRVLGTILYCPDTQHEGFTEFPSPESLKGRIIISTKPPKEYLLTTQDSKSTDETSGVAGKQSTIAGEEDSWGGEILDDIEDDSTAEKAIETVNLYAKDAKEAEEEDDDEEEEAPQYKRIITIKAGKPSGESLKDALALEPYVKRISLSEPELLKVANAHPEVVVSFTKKNLLRIYPKGIRVDSSNYSPLKAWSHGAQMVAFNMQGYGRPLWLVHGLFRANGGSGYVRKPDFLTTGSFNPKEPGPKRKVLKIKIYQGDGWADKFKKGHFDAFSPPDFYTRVGIAGVKSDTIMRKTKTIMDSWTPHWNEEFEFHLTVPELALLKIEVHEYDAAGKDDFGGQTCLPVAELKPGIRAIPLYDKKGRELFPVKLLVRIHFEGA